MATFKVASGSVSLRVVSLLVEGASDGEDEEEGGGVLGCVLTGGAVFSWVVVRHGTRLPSGRGLGTGKHDGAGIEPEGSEEKVSSQLPPASKTAKAAIAETSKHANTTKIHAKGFEFVQFLVLPVAFSLLPFSGSCLIRGRSRSQL